MGRNHATGNFVIAKNADNSSSGTYILSADQSYNISFGNTIGNGTFSFLGTGAATFGGSLAVTGTSEFTGSVRFDSTTSFGNHAIDTTTDIFVQSNGTMTGVSQASVSITSLASLSATTDAGQLYLNGRSANSSFTTANQHLT